MLTHSDDDPSWQYWQFSYINFYNKKQRVEVSNRVNDVGYIVMSSNDLNDNQVLKIFASCIRHIKCWQGKLKEYLLGTSQLCRSHPGQTRSGAPPRSRGLLATSLAARARPQSGHTALLARANGVMRGG